MLTRDIYAVYAAAFHNIAADAAPCCPDATILLLLYAADIVTMLTHSLRRRLLLLV